MKNEVQDDVQLLDKGASEMALVNEFRGREPNKPFGVRSVGKEKCDMAGRAYEYYHKLQ